MHTQKESSLSLFLWKAKGRVTNKSPRSWPVVNYLFWSQLGVAAFKRTLVFVPVLMFHLLLLSLVAHLRASGPAVFCLRRSWLVPLSGVSFP